MGSCTGFAIVGAMEYLENVKHKTFVPLSQQFVYYNERLLEGGTSTDGGSYIGDGISVVLRYGACALSVWPYNEADLYTKPSDAAYADGATRKAIKTNSIAQNQTAVMSALASGFPIVFGFVAFDSFESTEVAKTGFVPTPNPDIDNALGGHAMLIVGYDIRSQQFLCRNSWTAHWGIGGYCWIPFAYLMNPELAHSFYTIEDIDWPTA